MGGPCGSGNVLPGTLLLAIAMILGSCASGPALHDHFYRLELPEPERRLDSPPLKGTLQVDRPWADALTGERPLLYRQNSGSPQVHRQVYHRWADSPTVMIQQELTRYLRASGLATQVVTRKLRVNVDYVLTCHILRLERVLDGSPRVVMELELGITSLKDNQALLLQSYREEQAANSDEVDASIDAYNQALHSILNRFLADTSRIPAGVKPATGSSRF